MIDERATQPLGILRSGASARVDDRGTVEPAGVGWQVRWWVAGEDRWHRPDVDAAVRQRMVDETPVVETALRIPGGDAVAESYAFAAGGDPVLAGRVTNASPVPVAVAVVIGPASSITVDGTMVVVDGRHVLELSRRPSASVAAASLDALGDAVVDATDLVPAMAGFAAIVMPLPHSQTAAWQVRPVDRPTAAAPDPGQVATGWLRHAESGAQLTLPDGDAARFARARHLVALGLDDDASVPDVAAQVGSALRLGWFDAALEGTDRLGAAQRGNGRIGDDDRSTIDALDALSAWRRAGIPADGLDHLIGPVAGAARRLVRRRRHFDGSTGAAALGAIRAAAAFLAAVDQTEIADRLEAAVATLVNSEAPSVTASASVVADGNPVAVAGEMIDAVVADDRAGLVILDGWSPRWDRQPIEAAGVPTPWGIGSLALRWHGDRPALLWEVEPWPDVRRGEPTLRAPRLDPAWRGSGWRGEALLSAPASIGVDWVEPPSAVDQSFS